MRPGVLVHWWQNPKHLLPRCWSMVVGMWRLSEGGMARGWLPASGGVADQPAWLMDAFLLLASEQARLDKQKRGER